MYPENVQAEIATSINTAALGGQDTVAVTAHQELETPLSYFTKKDWTTINNDTVQMQGKVHIIAKRMYLVGLHSPSDTTLRKLCAIVCIALGLSTPEEWRSVVKEVRAQWKIVKRTCSSHSGFACDASGFL